MSRGHALAARLQVPYRQLGAALSARFEAAAVSCPMRRLRLTVGACALLAAGGAPARAAGTLDGLSDAQIAARFAPRLVLHPASATRRRAPTSCSRSARRSSTAAAASCGRLRWAPRRCPPGAAASAGSRAPTPCAWAAACRGQAVPGARRRSAADLRARRAPPPGHGQRPRLVRPPDPRMPFPGLEVVVQYWLYSLVDDWRSTPRSVTLPAGARSPAGGASASRGRLGGDHRRDVGGSPALRRLERTLRRRVAAVHRRDARPIRRGADPPRLVGGARLARQPAGPRDRAAALVALRSARRDVRAPARRRRDRPGGHGRDRQPPGRRARHLRPRRDGPPQAYPLALVNRLAWPMTFPGILGRPRAGRGRPSPPGARLVAPHAQLQKLWRGPLTTIFADAARSRAADGGTLIPEGLSRYGHVASPHSRLPWRFPLQPLSPHSSRSRTSPTPPVRGPTTSSPRCGRSRRATATS